jgi:peroxiredoxin
MAWEREFLHMNHENAPQARREPLPFGRLAPDFRLESAEGSTFTREQFRGRHGLVVLFVNARQPAAEPLLKALGQDWAEYIEINTRILAIADLPLADLAPLAAALALPFPLLADADNRVWQAYTGETQRGAALFVLDTYGATSAQRLVLETVELPDAAEILELARYTQYQCSV